jgi:hypothetical protein
MSQKPSDTISFPLTDLDRGIVDILPFMPDPSRWPAFNAVRHLNRAWRLREIDPQMAMFRAVTAEEEAATAIFQSLKRRGYSGTVKLKHRDHVHKNAVIPFFDAITRVIAKIGDQMPKTELILNSEEKRMEIRFRPIDPADTEDVWNYPTPPLHFSLSGGPATGMKKEDFAGGVKEIVSGANVKDIIEYIRNRANFRNQLLYAAHNGYPNVSQDIESEIQHIQRHVFIILRMYMLIDPYPSKQLFVQQALDAFLRLLRVMPQDLSDAAGELK